jgi:hypothetical protein
MCERAALATHIISMGRLPDNVLSELRTLPHALADLMAKHKNMPRDHPERSGLARMIRLLSEEIAMRRAVPTRRKRRTAARD